MPVFVKASRRSKAYIRKSALGRVGRAKKVMEKLKAQAWKSIDNPVRENTLHIRYARADRIMANAKSAIRTRRAIGFRTRQAARRF